MHVGCLLRRDGVAHHLPLLIEVHGTVLLLLVLPLRIALLLPVAIPVLRGRVLVHTALAIGASHQVVYAELRLLLEAVLGIAVHEVEQLCHDLVLAEALLTLLYALPLQQLAVVLDPVLVDVHHLVVFAVGR